MYIVGEFMCMYVMRVFLMVWIYGLECNAQSYIKICIIYKKKKILNILNFLCTNLQTKEDVFKY